MVQACFNKLDELTQTRQQANPYLEILIIKWYNICKTNIIPFIHSYKREDKMDKKLIKAFLGYHNPPIDNDWVIGFLVVNILAFGAGAFFSQCRIINACVVGIICIALLIFHWKITRHRKKTDDFFWLLSGIYGSMLSISLNYLSFMLLKHVFGHPVILFCILFFATAVAGAATWFGTYYAIITGKYIGKKAVIASTGAAACGVCMSRVLKNYFSGYVILGVCIGVCGILMISFLQNMMRYHYYHKLKELEKAEKEIERHKTAPLP